VGLSASAFEGQKFKHINLGPVNDFLVLVGAWLLMAWFSFSVGLIIAGLSEIFEPSSPSQFVTAVRLAWLPVHGVEGEPAPLNRSNSDFSPLASLR
jgi:hypothetical protein